MQFTVAAVAFMASTAAAWNYGTTGAVSYTTEVYTSTEFYCPYATQVTAGGKTYTVTEATTLTITDCPCTTVKPVTVTPIVAPQPIYHNTTMTTAVAPVTTPETMPPTTPVVVGPTASSPSGTSPPSSTFTGAANRAVVGSAAGLAGLLGLAAFAL